ncbi:MAG: hypothetical protein HY815_18305 [Candidatus Riflebacteria bacterium]|nr:hypothetical protein [Candidatus Riflebacteria bacterium]
MKLKASYLDDHRLDRVETPDGVSTYSWMFDNILSEFGADGSEAVFNVGRLGMDQTLERGAPQGPRETLLGDHLESVVGVADDSGSLIRSSEFLAFGVLRVGSDPGAVGFAGARKDPGTGLANLRNRWMDAGRGSFLSRDPLGMLQLAALAGLRASSSGPIASAVELMPRSVLVAIEPVQDSVEQLVAATTEQVQLTRRTCTARPLCNHDLGAQVCGRREPPGLPLSVSRFMLMPLDGQGGPTSRDVGDWPARYAYVGNSPIDHVDPTGLVRVRPPCGQWVIPPPPLLTKKYCDSIRRWCFKCCDTEFPLASGAVYTLCKGTCELEHRHCKRHLDERGCLNFRIIEYSPGRPTGPTN